MLFMLITFILENVVYLCSICNIFKEYLLSNIFIHSFYKSSYVLDL